MDTNYLFQGTHALFFMSSLELCTKIYLKNTFRAQRDCSICLTN